MNMDKMKLIGLSLRTMADNIDNGTCNMSDDEMNEMCELIDFMSNDRNKYSKYQACKYLGISRATFDNYVKDGKLPEGRQQQGFKEKF